MPECPGCAARSLGDHIYGHGADTSDVNWRDDQDAPQSALTPILGVSPSPDDSNTTAPPPPSSGAILVERPDLEGIQQRVVGAIYDYDEDDLREYLGEVVAYALQQDAQLATMRAEFRQLREDRERERADSDIAERTIKSLVELARIGQETQSRSYALMQIIQMGDQFGFDVQHRLYLRRIAEPSVAALQAAGEPGGES